MKLGPKDWSPRGEEWIAGAGDVHVVEVSAVAPGGNRHSFLFEAVFPKGTAIMAVSAKGRLALPDGREVHPVEVLGLTRSGRRYRADYAPVFPPKCELTGVRASLDAEK